MKTLLIYSILTEDGRSLSDIRLDLQEDFTWVDVFDTLFEKTGEEVCSYSYKEIS